MNKINNVDALILAGGKSSRMNFTDKALLNFDKTRTFLEKISDEMYNFENLMVSLNPEQNFLVPRGVIITDSTPDIGPLEGIHQGLLNAKSNFIFVTTCDMPNITKEFIDFVMLFLSSDYDAIIIKDTLGKTYPLFGLYNKSALTTIEGFLMDKNYRLQDVLAELNVKYISLNNTTFDYKKLLKSIDTQEELKHLSIFMGNRPFISICGAKNSGKTWLIQELIKHFKDASYKVATIKYNPNLDLNSLDPDINKYKTAGASGSLVFSKDNYILLKNRSNESFFQYLNLFKDFDIILLEDFKHEPFPKIEILKKDISSHPSANPQNLLFYVTDIPELLEKNNSNSINIEDTTAIFKKLLKIASLN